MAQISFPVQIPRRSGFVVLEEARRNFSRSGVARVNNTPYVHTHPSSKARIFTIDPPAATSSNVFAHTEDLGDGANPELHPARYRKAGRSRRIRLDRNLGMSCAATT